MKIIISGKVGQWFLRIQHNGKRFDAECVFSTCGNAESSAKDFIADAAKEYRRVGRNGLKVEVAK